MMIGFCRLVLIAAVATALFAPAQARSAIIDFESIAPGRYTSLVLPDLTLTHTGGNGEFVVQPTSSSGNTLAFFLAHLDDLPGGAFRVDFTAGGVTSVSIDLATATDVQFGNWAALIVNDAMGNMLAGDDFFVPEFGYARTTLSVTTTTPIAVAFFLIQDFLPEDGGTPPGLAYWDNLTYTTPELPVDEPPVEVPAPGTLALLCIGLAVLRPAIRRRRRP